jgi:hypothetical protein
MRLTVTSASYFCLDKSSTAATADYDDNDNDPNPPTASEKTVKFGVYHYAHLQNLFSAIIFYAEYFFREYTPIIKN